MRHRRGLVEGVAPRWCEGGSFFCLSVVCCSVVQCGAVWCIEVQCGVLRCGGGDLLRVWVRAYARERSY